MPMEHLQTQLRSLRLGGMAKTLPARYQEARTQETDCLLFLEALLQDEWAKRKDTLLNRRVKLARLPFLSTLEGFDFTFNPELPKQKIQELVTSRFVQQNENLLLIGPPGVGKTRVAVSVGLAAIENGYSVFYRSAFDLVEEMHDAAKADNRKKYVHSLARHQLLIIDELGMKVMPPYAADDLLEIIHRRYAKTATLIATNRPIEDWGTILGDNAATSAILDRFLDNALVLPFKGKSYRLNRPK